MNLEQRIWRALLEAGLNRFAAAGLMGNLWAESALRPDNLQDCFNSSLGMTDREYTEAVDNGSYGRFGCDAAGYGLAQWTYPSRKARLLAFAVNRGCSIGDGDMQTQFLITELREDYPGVLRALLAAEDLRTASDKVLLEFERPADCSEGVQRYRAELGQRVLERMEALGPMAVGEAEETQESPETDGPVTLPTLGLGAEGESVRAMQALLICRGFTVGWAGADGMFGQDTLAGLEAYKRVKGLAGGGICGRDTWERLLKG